jgi:hypothetical protein
MKALGDFNALLEPVRAAAQELPREALPALCGALAALQAEILLPPAAPEPSPKEDRALSPAEVARRIGRSQDWVYRHRHELPITRLSSGRWTVTESRLRRWMDVRSP